MASVLVGVGTAAHLPCDLALALPDGHPSTQPGFQLMLDVDDDVITRADVRIGLMHRSMEKLYEARDYRQLMMLADRQDWLSAFSTELLIALTVESAMGISVPRRATLIRTLMAEAARAFAVLAFAAAVLPDGPARDLAREVSAGLTSAQEVASGSRVHPMHARIGGVAGDLDADARNRYRRVADTLAGAADPLRRAVIDATSSLVGVAVVSEQMAIDFALLGPVGRASGLDRDVRLDEPYLVYGELVDLLAVPAHAAGDAVARHLSFVDQLAVCARVMHACLDLMVDTGGGIDVPLPKVVRVPEGTFTGRVEGPLGRTSCLLVSTGGKTPWRLAMRTPSFATAQAMGAALEGTSIDDLAHAVMSFYLAVGDIDR